MADLGELVLRLRVDDGEYVRALEDARRRAASLRDIDINLDSQGAVSGLKNIDGELKKLPNSADNVGKSFGALQGIIAGAAAAITTSLISIGARLASIPGQIASISLGNFRDFDAELQQFAALSGKSRDEIAPLTDEIQRLGIETTKAPTEIAAAANALVVLGANADDVQTQLAGVVALSESTGVGLDQAAQLIQLAANTFGFSAEEIADKLAILKIRTAADVGDVQQLIQQTSGIFNALGEGADPDELLALFATLRDGGLNAEVAATGLRGVIATLVDPGKKNELKQLGVSAFDAEGNFLGLETVLRQLQKTQGEINPDVFTGRLVGTFGREGVATITTGLDLLDSKFTTTLANIQNAQGTAAESSAILTQGFAGSLLILQGSLETLSIAFGEALAPLVQFGAELATQLANTLLTTPNLFEPISLAIERFKAALTGNPELLSSLSQSLVELVAIGVGALGDALVGVAQFFEDPANIQAVVKSFQDFVAVIGALAALIGPLASIAAAITGIFNAANNSLNTIPLLGEAFNNFFNPVERIRAVLALVNGALNSFQFIANLIGPIVQGLSTPFQFLGNIIDALKTRIDGLLASLGLLRAQGIRPDNIGQSLAALANPGALVLPRKHGGPVLPGQTYLAGEAGPELLRMGGKDALITAPSLMRFDQPGRIYSAPRTRRKLSDSALGRGSVGGELRQVRKLLQQAISKPTADINTTVEIQGMSPDAMRRQLALHQLDLYRSMGGF